jgi:hypothetical protein
MPSDLNEIILTAMKKDPAQRFATADALRAALETIRQRPSTDFAPTVPYSQPAPGSVRVEASGGQRARQAPARTFAAPAAPDAQFGGVPQIREGHRGLWMAAGAVACVAVLAVGAVMLPHFFNSAASSRKTETDSNGYKRRGLHLRHRSLSHLGLLPLLR